MRSERGVALILGAFALVLGLWGLLTLAWLPLVHRNARLELQLLADAACGGVSNEDAPGPGMVNAIPFQLGMWEAFRAKFAEPERKYVEVMQASLYLATPPAAAPANLYSPSPGVLSGETSSEASWNSTQGSCFQDGVTQLVTSLEPLNCGSDFTNLSDVVPTAATNNIRNFGNTGICYLRGEVKSELFGISLSFLEGDEEEREIEVVSGFWAPVRGINSSPPLVAPPMDASNSPGMVIAVAPQMRALDQITDWGLDNRFRFPAGHEFRSGDEFDIELTPVNCGNIAGDSAGPRFAFSCAKNTSLAGTTKGESLPLTEFPSDIIGKRYGCLNPLILARNMFISTLTSLAARHGQLRGRTEMYLVNSQVDGAAVDPSPPAIMLGADQDILSTDFSPPYLFFRGYELSAGVQSQLSPVFFDTDPVTGANALERYTTSQLAQCSHLFSGLRDTATFSSFLQDRLAFAPNPGFNGPYDYFQGEPDSRGVNALTNLVWESDAFGFDAGMISEPVALHPAVSSLMLGAVRYCPFYGAEFAGTRCENLASRGTLTLSPDLEGLLTFLSDSAGMAIRQDRVGIIRRTEILDESVNTILRGGDYNFPLTAFIGHDVPPDVAGLGDLFNNYTSPLGLVNVRPFHVVLFPTGSINTTALEQAMQVQPGTGREFLHSVSVIQPCELRADISNGRRYPDFCDDVGNLLVGNFGGTEDSLYRAFWLALAGEAVLPGNVPLPVEDTAYGRALEFFRTKVTRASSLF